MVAEITIATLQAQRIELEKQIAGIAVPLVEAAIDRLSDKAAAKLLADMQALHEKLPEGAARTQINNVIVVLSKVPEVLKAEAAKFRGMTGELVEAVPAPAPA